MLELSWLEVEVEVARKKRLESSGTVHVHASDCAWRIPITLPGCPSIRRAKPFSFVYIDMELAPKLSKNH